ncbi:30S ribosomal protein S7 [Candidatus Gromoviella agglomerans]|uniref:30S ribosomal protein S7 n=1 Tax=Candidatus Gromoviella agglomerans TaxID=2806609 RepID=UPI001E4BAE25|nr:30S ribosomal protein S7 [Candidatus Gromoviella agglomerans]UFX98554.1 30S ribosomal protein S7 [Candidatus Gromoviella agglomerans]
MSRRARANRREISPDYKYGDVLLAKFINCVMWEGKRFIAEKIVYEAIDAMVKEVRKSGVDDFEGKSDVDIFTSAIRNVRPTIEVKSKRVGGATYQVPVLVDVRRSEALAIRWIIGFARKRGGMPMMKRLSIELLDAYFNRGSAIKKREDTTKMAEANRAFARFRW